MRVALRVAGRCIVRWVGCVQTEKAGNNGHGEGPRAGVIGMRSKMICSGYVYKRAVADHQPAQENVMGWIDKGERGY